MHTSLTHHVTVSFSPGHHGWVASCECGWRSDYSDIHAWAVRQGELHEGHPE